MSRFIDLVETFDFTTLTFESYGAKIDSLLERFPKYEKDDRFRTVVPSKFVRTADDYISMKFCTRGRYPIFGIYNRRDFDLVAVCVEGNIMFALDDCQLHPSLVPDLRLHKLSLGIQCSPLATRETLNYTKKCMCSAISTLSLGYTPQKKNEWCEAVVLLTGMTSQAVRFCKMKHHVQLGLLFTTAHDAAEHDGRYVLFVEDIAMQNRWNKISKAIRREEYPYVFSHYNDHGPYATGSMTEFSAGCKVSLINDRDKTRRQKFRRRINKWNGPLGNSIRKREEENQWRWLMERETKRTVKMVDSTVLESTHGFWYGSVENFKYEVAFVKCLPRHVQIFRDNRYLLSATPPLSLKVVLQVQATFASTFPMVKNIWNEGSLLAFFRGTSMILENWGSGLYFWLRRPGPNLSLRAAMHGEIVDCTRPVFAAAASNLCAKRHKVKVDRIKLRSDFNSVSTSMKDLCSDHFGISKEKIEPEKVKWNREPRPFVQLARGRISRALGATCVCPLQVIMRRMHARHPSANARYPGMSAMRTFQRFL